MSAVCVSSKLLSYSRPLPVSHMPFTYSFLKQTPRSKSNLCFHRATLRHMSQNGKYLAAQLTTA